MSERDDKFMNDFSIMAIKINQRVQKATDVQELLTEYGCNIKMRLGLHEAGDVCSNQGLILLQLTDDDENNKEFEKKLNAIEGVTAKTLNI